MGNLILKLVCFLQLFDLSTPMDVIWHLRIQYAHSIYVQTVQNWSCRLKRDPNYSKCTQDNRIFFQAIEIHKDGQKSPHHCCYQGAFQEVNILINRAHLVNVKLILTESLCGKIYFSKTVIVISNLMNILGTIFSGQTFVQK